MSGFPNIFEDKLSDLPEEKRVTISDAASSKRLLELEVNPIKGNFDKIHLQDIHKHLFKDISSQAGVIRRYNMKKGDTVFADRATMTYIFEKELPKKISQLDAVKDQPIKYSKQLASVHSSLDEAHPFREGNGRSARAFLTQLANEHGYTLDFNGIDRKQWIEASIQSIKTLDNSAKETIFRQATQPIDRNQFIRKAIQDIHDAKSDNEKTQVYTNLTHREVTQQEVKTVAADMQSERQIESITKAPTDKDDFSR